MTSMAYPQELPEKPKPQTAKELCEALQRLGAFGLWSDIPVTESSVTLARHLRESQTRY